MSVRFCFVLRAACIFLLWSPFAKASSGTGSYVSVNFECRACSGVASRNDPSPAECSGHLHRLRESTSYVIHNVICHLLTRLGQDVCPDVHPVESEEDESFIVDMVSINDKLSSAMLDLKMAEELLRDTGIGYFGGYWYTVMDPLSHVRAVLCLRGSYGDVMAAFMTSSSNRCRVSGMVRRNRSRTRSLVHGVKKVRRALTKLQSVHEHVSGPTAHRHCALGR